MNNAETKTGIEKLFRDALQALAASPEEQVGCTEPADVPAEIMEDYLLWADSYVNYFGNDLDPEAIRYINELTGLVDSLPDSIFRETNLESMQQPEWQPLRIKAQLLLEKLQWPVEPPSPFLHKGRGVYERK